MIWDHAGCFAEFVLLLGAVPKPLIHWTSFNKESGEYQGEIDHKGQFTKHFLRLRQLPDGYVTSKLEAVLDVIVAECIKIAEHKNMATMTADEDG